LNNAFFGRMKFTAIYSTNAEIRVTTLAMLLEGPRLQAKPTIKIVNNANFK
jgi:hypothetical protein